MSALRPKAFAAQRLNQNSISHINIRLFHTLRHLRLRQILYQVFYRLTGRLTENGARSQVQSSLGVKSRLPPFAEDLRAPANALPVRYTEAGFCFLHKTVHFPSFGAIDWNFAEHGKLWTYNLNYFEYLRQPGLDPDVGEQLIGAWITEDTTHRDGWEPYTISLRLVNWLQFYRSYGRAIPARVHTSIRRQYVALWRKREYHLGGNHLLENAIALSMASRYLKDDKGQQKADRLLLIELREQYLPDGAHFELSVMYHLILLWRQLDLYSWLVQEGRDDHRIKSPPSAILVSCKKTLLRQLAWAKYIITPDGRYPHFNDSTKGIAPDWAAVQRYAEELGLLPLSPTPLHTAPASLERGSDNRTAIVHKEIALAFSPPTPPTPPTRGSLPAYQPTSLPDYQTTKLPNYQPTRLPDYKTTQLSLWIDAAQIGPTYIPGHAHADNLTFVLHSNGEPVVVDPSISTYEKNDRRSWERSTAAHNTVVVRQRNSSDVWGGFRVGRRAKTYIYKNTESTLIAEHDGYGETSHYRTFDCSPTGIIITDELTGELVEGTARLHFAPGLQPSVARQTLRVFGLCFTFAGATRVELFNYQYAAGFNRLTDGVGVKLVFQGKLVTTITGDTSG